MTTLTGKCMLSVVARTQPLLVRVTDSLALTTNLPKRYASTYHYTFSSTKKLLTLASYCISKHAYHVMYELFLTIYNLLTYVLIWRIWCRSPRENTQKRVCGRAGNGDRSTMSTWMEHSSFNPGLNWRTDHSQNKTWSQPSQEHMLEGLHAMLAPLDAKLAKLVN